jgi:hypothetical protein
VKFLLEQIKCPKCIGHGNFGFDRTPDGSQHAVLCPHCSGTGLQKAYVISEEVLSNTYECLKTCKYLLDEEDKKHPDRVKASKYHNLDKVLRSLIAPEENK